MIPADWGSVVDGGGSDKSGTGGGYIEELRLEIVTSVSDTALA